MITSKSLKSQRKFLYIFVISFMVFSQVWIPSAPANQNQSDKRCSDFNTDTEEKIEEILKFSKPFAQNYQTNKTGTKDIVDVTIHQALNDSTLKNINQGSNSYLVNAPNATNYNVSNSLVQIDSLTTQNATLKLEGKMPDAGINWDEVSSRTLVSFESKVGSYLTNLTIYVKNTSASTNANQLNLYLYSAINSSNNPVPGDYNNDKIDLGSLTGISNTIGIWTTITFTLSSTYYLDPSSTFANTWYIGYQDFSILYGGDVAVGYHPDSEPTYPDESDAYYWNSGWTSF